MTEKVERMKKFSRMPKSESGGLGGASGSGSSSGVSSYFGKVFAVGRFQVTVEELVAEGMSTSAFFPKKSYAVYLRSYAPLPSYKLQLVDWDMLGT